MKKQVAIRVSDVQKSFKLPHEKNTSLKSLIIHPLKRRTFERQHVLQDISFEIKKGEFFGIVGRNGSGKSTLLKLLAGIYTPNKGSVHVYGKLTPFIELGVGFNPELTGRENVFLNSALLGFNRKETNDMYDEIVEFAELGSFMDQKLKNYSSGMQVRLAFSIAVRANSDIFLIDEVLAVGDANFQKKCMDFFEQIKGKRTVVFVSHDMKAVERFCDRVLVLEKSKIVDLGKPEDMVFRYGAIMANSDLKTTKVVKEDRGVHIGSGEAAIKRIRLVDPQTGKTVRTAKSGEDLVFEISIHSDVALPQPVLHLAVFSDQNQKLYSVNTLGRTKFDTGSVLGDVRYQITIRNNPFAPGRYKINFGLFGKDLIKVYDHHRDALEFSILGVSEIDTRLLLQAQWKEVGGEK